MVLERGGNTDVLLATRLDDRAEMELQGNAVLLFDVEADANGDHVCAINQHTALACSIIRWCISRACGERDVLLSNL